MKPTVVIVVLNFNGAEDTINCLNSVLPFCDENHRCIVVDNASTDDSVLQIRLAFPDLTILESDVNRGFAAGNNIGMRHANERAADSLWLLNNDTIVERDSLSTLVKHLESQPRIGLAGSVIYELSHPAVIQSYGGGHVNLYTGHTRNVTRIGGNITYITGASLLIRGSVIKKHLLDERFFFLWEDVEYCLRVRKAGWQISVCGESVIFHKGGGTEPRLSVRRIEWHAFGLVRTFRKHCLFAFPRTLPIGFYYLMLCFRFRSLSPLKAGVRGWTAGWRSPLTLQEAT